METITPEIEEVTTIKKFAVLWHYAESDFWTIGGGLFNLEQDATGYIPKGVDRVVVAEFNLPLHNEPSKTDIFKFELLLDLPIKDLPEAKQKELTEFIENYIPRR